MLSITFLIYFFVFFLGAIFGSFLNVISVELEPNVFQLKEKKSFWKRINRRSSCPTCNHVLTPYELVPIFSYLFLRGKCFKCKKRIPLRYLMVEIFSGSLFIGFFYYLFGISFSFLNLDFFFNFLFLIPIISSLILIFLFDFKHKIIPNLVLIPFFLISVVYLFVYGWVDLDFFNLGKMFLGAAFFAFPFWAMWFLSKGRAMGFADWKLIFILSFYFKDLLQNLLFVFMSFWIGSLYVILSLFLKKKLKLSSEIPFGPFIILSFIVVLIFDISYFSFSEILNF